MAYDLIVGTTKIVGGHSLTETFIESLGWLAYIGVCFFLFYVLFFEILFSDIYRARGWGMFQIYSNGGLGLSYLELLFESMCLYTIYF